MINLTGKQIQALHSFEGARQEFYKCEILKNNEVIEVPFKDATLNVNSEYEVKRSATLTLYDMTGIDAMKDKVQLSMGVMVDGCIEWWVLGTFRIMKVVGRVLQLADETIVLQQSKLIEKKVFYQGTLYTDALKWFLISSGITFFDIQASTLTLQADIICDDSKSKLAWFNYIADQINYLHLYIAGNGYFTSKKYEDARHDRVGYTYTLDKCSVIKNVSSDIDTWSVPNVFKRVLSRGDLPPLVSVYINDNPTSKFSTTYRGMEICDFKTVDLIGSQEELDLLVSRVAQKSMQLEEVLKIETINMPHHEIYDIIQLEDNLYNEVSYSMKLGNNGNTTHYLKRVIFDDTRPKSV